MKPALDHVELIAMCNRAYDLLCHAVKTDHEYPAFYHISNECNMINRIVLGMTSKQYQSKYNITVSADAGIRPYLNDSELMQIYLLQLENVRLIMQGISYQDRKILLSISYQIMHDTIF